MQETLKKQEIEYQPHARKMLVNIHMASTCEKRIKRIFDEFNALGNSIIDEFEPGVEVQKAMGSITTLKTPCGQGTKTFSRFKIFVYQRKFSFRASHAELEKAVTLLKNYPGVEIDLDIKN